tara:strand:- start:103 stop:264 length:162 start_codon:yes stop_codon:yes gene_type:complete
VQGEIAVFVPALIALPAMQALVVYWPALGEAQALVTVLEPAAAADPGTHALVT